MSSALEQLAKYGRMDLVELDRAGHLRLIVHEMHPVTGRLMRVRHPGAVHPDDRYHAGVPRPYIA